MTTIQGFDEFSGTLEQFAGDLEDIADEIDEAIDRGTAETALSIEKTAKVKAPVRDGELRADIKALKMAMAIYSIGTTKKYGPSMEYGSKPHSITPNGPYPLRFFWEKKGRWVSTYQVDHPGTEAQPFIRPALNKHRSSLVENINQEIQEVIDAQL